MHDVGENIFDAEERDLDMLNKEKGRTRADKDRKVRVSDIEAGEKVLL